MATLPALTSEKGSRLRSSAASTPADTRLASAAKVSSASSTVRTAVVLMK
jgi:hypothetical protein